MGAVCSANHDHLSAQKINRRLEKSNDPKIRQLRGKQIEIVENRSIVAEWIDPEKKDGYGIICDQEGLYEGNIRGGKAEGYGKFIMGNNIQYEGAMYKGKANGNGRYQQGDMLFKGKFLEGVAISGQIQLKSQKGVKFIVHELCLTPQTLFQAGSIKIEKQGDFTYKGDIEKIEERFMFEGKGTMSWTDGSTYKGEWKEGKMHGLGEYKWSPDRFYEGKYKKGKKHGAGKFYTSRSKFLKGQWDEGKKNGLFQVVEVSEREQKVVGQVRFDHGRLIQQ